MALGFGSVAIVGCGQQGGTTGNESQAATPEYADEAFIDSMSKGLEARWKLLEELKFDNAADEEKVMRQLVNAELEYVESYTTATFEDSKLQEKAIQYVNLLKDQLEALQYTQVDYVKYGEIWDKAYNERTKLLVDFTDNYGLTVSSEWAETLNDMKVNATMVAEKEDKQAKIEALGNGAVFEKASEDSYDRRYTAVVENNMGFDVNTYHAEVIFYDDEDVNVGTGYVTVNSWKNGQKAQFEIYAPVDYFASTEIVVAYWE